MATTTNFGWETPDDTDLVKDGALAIRTLGSAIDTSLVDLKGGTTGQVLSKTSNTDMDFTWVTSNDADAIQNAIVDAKGDLITATAADTPARLAVGTNGYVLSANSATATGLEWIAASSGDWTFGTWTPTYTSITIGNGTVTARYAQKGNLVVAEWKLVFGSTSSIANFARLTTPVNIYANDLPTALISMQAGNVNYVGHATGISNLFYIKALDASASYVKWAEVSSTVPGTWSNASGDYIAFTIVYEAA